MLDKNQRYLQIAFNYDLGQVARILPRIPRSSRILIEAGTPFIKKEGAHGIRKIASAWGGHLVADLKVADGAEGEVRMARYAGATAATVHGNSPTETLNLFIDACRESGMDSMIDLVGVQDPLTVLRRLKRPPTAMVLHKGRDEESTGGKVIAYKHVKRIKSKHDVLISAAGGVDLKEARTAIFNGADIVVANVVTHHDPWVGIDENEDVGEIARKFLETIE